MTDGEGKDYNDIKMTTSVPASQEIVRDKLGRYLPGCSGNPKGMPPGTVSLVGLLKKRLEEHPEQADKIISEFIRLGVKPNMTQLAAIDKLFDRIDGKVPERHRIDGELPIRLVFQPAGDGVNAIDTRGQESLDTVEDMLLIGRGQE